AVSEHLGYVQCHTVVLGQLDSEVLEVAGRAGPQVDDDVVDGAARAAHQFRLGSRRHLVVHAAQSALCMVERHVGLCDGRFETMLLELPSAESTGEEAAFVRAFFEFDDEGTLQGSFVEVHAVTASRMRASSQKNWSSIWPVVRRCLSIFKRVN